MLPQSLKTESNEVREVKSSSEPLLVRLHHAFGPIAGAVILDFADFVTLGPIGLFVGLAVGFLVGWWISSIYGFSTSARILWASLAGLYCMIPLTPLIPLATFISAVARFRGPTI